MGKTYIFIDGKWHELENLADGSDQTLCGISELPYHADWSRNEPDENRCKKCEKAAKDAAA